MIGIENFGLFIITALLFIITPGIDTIFVLNKSIGQGKKAGIFASIGINGGVLIHTLFAALGLSLLVAKSATAFLFLKYAGALYLVFLGIQKLVSKKDLSFSQDNQEVTSNKKHFVSGLITNTLNPKVALFFLSFFPQFISKSEIENPVPFIILGTVYALIGLIWFLLLNYFSSMFSNKIQGNETFNTWLNKFSGIVFIMMGLKVALSKK